MKRLLFCLLLSVAVFLAGCQARNSPAPRRTSAPSASGAVSGLAALEDTALEAMNMAEAQDWDASGKEAEVLQSLVSAQLALPESAGLPKETADGLNAAATELAAAVRAEKQYDVLIQANLVTKYVSDLAAFYKQTMLSDFMLLGYLAREMAIDVGQQSWTTALADIEDADGVWLRLKALLDGASKEKAEKLEKALQTLRGDIESRDLGRAKSGTEDFIAQLGALRKASV